MRLGYGLRYELSYMEWHAANTILTFVDIVETFQHIALYKIPQYCFLLF